MTAKTKNFTDINQDDIDALAAALDKFGMNTDAAVVKEHYEFLVEKGRFELIKHPNHLKNAMEKYAKFYREASNTVKVSGGSRADARELAYTNATTPDDLDNVEDYASGEESEQAPQEDATDKRRRGNGSAPKPKPATTTPPAQQTPQDAPHETERAPVESEAAGELMHIGHAESPVTVHPDWKGDVLDEHNGVRYFVSLREGGTAEQALHIISEYRKFWDMGKQYGVVCAQYDPDEGKLETGGKGTLEFDRIVWSAKTFKGETSDYLEFWREGRDYASNSTRKAEEIKIVEQALGVQFKSGQPMTLEGGFIASYTLGNIKKDKEGKERPGTQWFDFYLNIEGVTRK